MPRLNYSTFHSRAQKFSWLTITLLIALLLCQPFATISAQPDSTPTPIPYADGLRLQFGQTAAGSITTPQQRDRYVLFGLAGTTITLGMFPASASSLVPGFDVYAPNGDVVIASSSPAGAVISGYQLPVTGAYIVFVGAKGGGRGGDYTFTATVGIAVRDRQQPILLVNQPLQGELTRLGDRDVYPVDLAAGADFAVEVVPFQSGLVPVLEVVDPNGNLLARASGQLGNRRVLLTPQIVIDGTYQVRVSAAGGQTTGAYLLRVTAPEPAG